MNFIEIHKANIDLYEKQISDFFQKNQDAYEFFKPHKLNFAVFKDIILRKLKDMYIFMANENEFIGYGILRGWDEGYETPSLGILISKSERGKGISIILMNKLHEIARNNNSKKIRLKVFKNNIFAIKLYQKLEYQLDELNDNELLGIKIL